MLSASLLSLFFLLAAVGASEGQTISAKIGENVTLPCSAKEYMPLEQMEWSRPGTHLQYVVIFRTQSQDLEIPEQRYEGRVELKDRENGDASLVLKNVTAEDGGTYECYVKRDTDRMKRAIQPVSTVYLDVLPPPPPGILSPREALDELNHLSPREAQEEHPHWNPVSGLQLWESCITGNQSQA